MKKPKKARTILLEPGIRIDGGKRTDLKLYRGRCEAKRKLEKPPVEDTRVSNAWVRLDAMSSVAKRKTAERKRMRSLADGGADGTQEFKQLVKISKERASSRTMRCRPGTFEWRYGRGEKLAAHFHAGNHFAQLWEKAGMAAAGSPDLEQNGGGGAWKGLPDGRVAALDTLGRIVADLGTEPKIRLIAYCVEGATAAEIGIWAGMCPRDAAAVIHSDMTALAKIMRYL